MWYDVSSRVVLWGVSSAEGQLAVSSFLSHPCFLFSLCLCLLLLERRSTILNVHYIRSKLYWEYTVLGMHFIKSTMYWDYTVLRVHYIENTLYWESTMLRIHLAFSGCREHLASFHLASPIVFCCFTHKAIIYHHLGLRGIISFFFNRLVWRHKPSLYTHVLDSYVY